jgi:hypothetical protein
LILIVPMVFVFNIGLFGVPGYFLLALLLVLLLAFIVLLGEVNLAVALGGVSPVDIMNLLFNAFECVVELSFLLKNWEKKINGKNE